MGAMRTMAGAGIGAGLMYYLDPDRGRRRRAIVRDKVIRLGHRVRWGLRKAVRDAGNRTVGVAAEARSSILRHGEPTDETLVARVRSKVGRVVGRPRAIEVSASDGIVTLRGPVLRHEVEDLISAVENVDGVREVRNELEPHESPDDCPALQGQPRSSNRADGAWTPALRLLVGATGGGLTVYSLAKRDAVGVAAGIVGMGLLARASANKQFKQIVGTHAIHIQKTMTIHAPVEEVFEFWSNYQNFPRFMRHIREVVDLGNGHSRWVAEGPAGTRVSWEAEIVERVPNQVLAWRSKPGSAIVNGGRVRFEPGPDNSTRIQVQMRYLPPAGTVGHLVASLFGVDPKQEMDDDFVRLKSLLEQGKTRSRTGEVVTLDQMEGVHGAEPERGW